MKTVARTSEQIAETPGLKTYQDMLWAIDESRLGGDAFELVAALFGLSAEQVEDDLEVLLSSRF